MKKIFTTKKAINVAKSLGVIIDKSIAASLNIKKGDLVEVTFKSISKKR